MQRVIVTLDQDGNVYLSGAIVGQGEVIWKEILNQIPLSQVEEVIVRDEGNPYSASEWKFEQPFSFPSLLEAIEFYPPIVYSVDYDTDQEELRRSELDTGMDPALRAHIENKTQTAQRDEPVEEQESTPVLEEPEEEEIEYDNPLEDAEYVDWSQQGNKNQDFALKNDFEFKTLQERGNFVGLPRGMTAGQVYLPGERLSKTPLAVKRQKLKINKQRSKVPFYMAGVIALVAIIILGVRWIATPDPTIYQAFCMDARTQLVAEKSYCQDKKENYQISWAVKSDVDKTKPKDKIPESTVFEEPSGNVEVLQF